MDKTTALIRLEHVRYRYSASNAWVLNDISLTVHAGERICIVGANGSGKSTLSRIIAGLEAPDHGTVDLMGHRVFDDDHGAYPDAYRQARRHLGAVFQNPADQLVTTRTQDDVAFGPENLAVPPDQIGLRVQQALLDVHMEHARMDDPTRMSGGQQQRIAIAGMLAMHSRVLVLDEPTAMLDPAARSEIMAVLDRIQRTGTAIVLVTHHHEETANADRIVRINNGRLESVTYSTLRNDDRAAQHEIESALRNDFQQSASVTKYRDHVADSTNDVAIRYEHVSFRYTNSPHEVLHDYSLTVRRGETVAITGSNGSGKTTLARLLCALETPSSGTIEVDGITVAAPRGSRQRRASRRQRDLLHRRVGYVMQHAERQLFSDTVAQDVAFGPRSEHLADDDIDQRVREALHMLHIDELADRSPTELSTGQQRLVAIAGVLACKPSILVFDEPSAGLDERARQRLMSIMRDLQACGLTMVIITHRDDEAELLADRTITLHPVVDSSSAAINQVDPLNSWMGRLDARVKILGSLILMFSAFAMTSYAQLMCGIAVTALLVMLSRMGLRRLLHRIYGFLALFVLFGALNIAVVRTGTVLMRAGPLTVTTDGITTAVLYTTRFSLVIIIAAVLLATTTPTAMTEAFSALLRPLHIFGLHVQEIALVFSLAMRFLPTLAVEAMSIRDAQACRGGSIESGSPMQRLRAMCAVIVPVFMAALRHADTLGLALDARCYEDGVARTHWHVLHTAKRDWIFALIVVAQLTGIVLCNIW